MKKFRIHPLFIPVAVILILSGKGLLFAYAFLAVLLHELGHYLSAKKKGYEIESLTITPYGALLSAESGLPDKDAFFVSAAGPIVNLSLALATVALWWIFPSCYGFTLDFFKANTAIGVFNLLPLYPLDGSRMLLSAVKDKLKCLKIMRITGLVVAAVCLVLFIISAFFKISYSLFLVSCMLISGILNDSKREKYMLLFKRAYYVKDFDKPLIKKELFVFPTMKIKKLLSSLSDSALYTVSVLDKGMKVKKVLDDKDLENMFFYDKEKTVGEYVSEEKE